MRVIRACATRDALQASETAGRGGRETVCSDAQKERDVCSCRPERRSRAASVGGWRSEGASAHSRGGRGRNSEERTRSAALVRGLIRGRDSWSREFCLGLAHYKTNNSKQR